MKWKLILVGMMAFFFGIPLLLGCKNPPNSIELSSFIFFISSILNYWVTTLEQISSEILLTATTL